MKLLKVYPITQDGRYPLFHETHSSKSKEEHVRIFWGWKYLWKSWARLGIFEPYFVAFVLTVFVCVFWKSLLDLLMMLGILLVIASRLKPASFPYTLPWSCQSGVSNANKFWLQISWIWNKYIFCYTPFIFINNFLRITSIFSLKISVNFQLSSWYDLVIHD